MIRSLALHDIPIDSIAAMERWYHRDHAPEIVRRYGPWLSRFECYLPVHAPADAQSYGFYNWRMTEGWWREVPEAGEGDPYFTPPPVQAKVAACFVPPQPTDVFRAGELLPLEKAPLRWLVLFRYPEGVSRDEGDEWFVGTHGPELAVQPGLMRLVGYRVVQDVRKVPGRWHPDDLPRPGEVRTSWDWVVELWYETFDDWRRWLKASEACCTRPGWSTQSECPFLAPGEGFVSTFILERPNDDFLRDLRAYVP